MRSAMLGRLDSKVRPFISMLPPKTATSIYSSGRLYFLKKLHEENPSVYIPPSDLSVTLWGITFQSPIMNAAGMFKNGECYEMVARQGAGGYLGGTGTWNARKGNEKEGINLPFIPYPKSHSSSNWLGLPNDGDQINSLRAKQLKRIAGTPIGWSIMGSPDISGEEKLECLVTGMSLYEQSGVDFLEINESCPNTSEGRPQDNDMAYRLGYIKENFLDRRTRNIPVIVKFSNDTQIQQLPYLLDVLFSLGYDGVNFGNTSTAYDTRRVYIAFRERKLFDFFTKTFGGGVSGRPLKESSLELAARSVEYIKAGSPSQEFHVIRTGGIETWNDIIESRNAGIQLNQWFTGYFENFSRNGHNVYKKFFA